LLNPTQNRLGYYYITLIIAVATFWFIRRLMNSPTGRVLLAIRENEQRAVAIGFDTLRYKLISITIASMLAALAGIMLVILNKKVGPELMSLKYTIDPLLMVIIGGLGTFTGPVLGAAGLHLSGRIFNRELMIGSTSINIGEYWSLILGVAFVIVVLVFPYGIVGTWNRWRTRSRQKIKRVASSND
jgi:branched-chain amino acid transport system permease protein